MVMKEMIFNTFLVVSILTVLYFWEGDGCHERNDF